MPPDSPAARRSNPRACLLHQERGPLAGCSACQDRQVEGSFTDGWPTYTPDALRTAATRLEQRPWLKPVEALRLWADVMEMEQQNAI